MSLKDGIPDLKLFPNLSETVEAVNGSFCLTRIQPREEVHVDNINEVVKKELYRLDDRTLWCFANVSYQGERMAFTELIYTSTSYQAQSQSFLSTTNKTSSCTLVWWQQGLVSLARLNTINPSFGYFSIAQVFSSSLRAICAQIAPMNTFTATNKSFCKGSRRWPKCIATAS